MGLKEKINDALKEAMRNKDQAGLRAIRAIKSAILLAETAEGKNPDAPLSEAEEMALLVKQSKQRKDSIDQFRKAGREDLAKGEEEELLIIEKFLPKQLSAEEIEAEVKKVIADLGAAGMKDMGKVIGESNKRMAGSADGKTIAEIVKKLLA